jgi:hypothetical protein
LLEVFPSRGGFCAHVNLGKNSTHQHQLPLGRPCKLSGSVKPSAGTTQRCEASARRYAGLVVMVSARALIVYHGRLRSTIASRRLYCQHGRSAR